jgi:hypothetical protein
MAINWINVSRSSHVTAIGRDDQTKDVGVKFHDGATYVYHDVSEADWETLQDHGSKGRYVNIVLRRRYRYEKM